MVDRILLPLNGVSDRDATLPHARFLARTTGAKVVVLQAIPFLETILEMPSEFAEGDKEEAERYVRAVVEDLRSDGIAAEGVVRLGSGVATIGSVARKTGASLIVLGAHGQPRFWESLFGTMIEKVLRVSPVPVYVAPAPAARAGREPTRPTKIVIPVDGTGLSLGILPVAASFARLFGVGFAFVHVVPQGGTTTRDVFEKPLDWCDRGGIPCETLPRRGDPAAEIVRASREIPGSMIAMRTRLTPNQPGGSLGSVAIRVLRRASVPMIVLRRAARGAPVRAIR